MTPSEFINKAKNLDLEDLLLTKDGTIYKANKPESEFESEVGYIVYDLVRWQAGKRNNYPRKAMDKIEELFPEFHQRNEVKLFLAKIAQDYMTPIDGIKEMSKDKESGVFG